MQFSQSVLKKIEKVALVSFALVPPLAPSVVAYVIGDVVGKLSSKLNKRNHKYKEKDAEKPTTKLDPLVSDFLNAIIEKNYEIVESLISEGVDINTIAGGCSPLHHAAIVNDIPLLELLIKHKANLNIESMGVTPIYLASEKGHADIVKKLLEAGAEPNIIYKKNGIGYTPLSIASQNGHAEIVKELLENGADPLISASPIDITRKNNTIMRNDTQKSKNDLLDSRFDKQIIIDFCGYGDGMQYKWDTKHPDNPCEVINGSEFLKNQNHLVQTQGVTRVYVIAHGFANYNYFVAGDGNEKNQPKIYPAQLAESLAHYIGDSKVVVNLISCAAARGKRDHAEDNSQNSLAAKLHLWLADKANRDIPVVARMQVMSMSSKRLWWRAGRNTTMDLKDSPEETQKIVHSQFRRATTVHRQHGSKVILKLDKRNNQIRLDAYTRLWKKRVLKTLATAKKGTTVEAKQKLLETLLTDFENKKNQYIYDTLKKEMQKSDSPLKQHSSSISRLFRKPNTYKKIEGLLKDLENIKKSKYTKYTKERIATGWNLHPSKKASK